MKRCLLLWLLVMLLPLCALADDGLTLKVNRDNSAQGFAENTITVKSDAAGSLSMSIGDDYGTYFTWDMTVEAGETAIPWNGLGWNMERITDGKHTLTATLTTADGTVLTAERTVSMKKCANAMTFALPGSSTLYLGDKEPWFCEVRCIRSGDVVCMEVYAADAPDTLLGTKKLKINAGGPVKFEWDGKFDRKALPAGEYALKFYLTANPVYEHHMTLTIAEGTTPEMEVAVTGPVMPERGMSDEEIWAVMQQPSVVADLKKQDQHLTIREGKGKGKELGTVHGQSQAMQVFEVDDGYARVGAWNHESGDYVEGWVRVSDLMVVTPNKEYGLLIDKVTQTMTVYHQGRAIDTFPISTGLAAEKRLIRETAAGAFLTVDRIGNFESDGYSYDHPIRYDGGNLIHQMGYDTVGTKHDFSDHTPLLGAKASHGCIRVSNVPSEGAGINAYWLYTHLPYHTRVILLDDPEARQLQKAAAGVDVGDMTVEPVAPPELAEGETELVITVGGDAVIGTREKWWNREDAFPHYIEQNGLGYPFRNLLPIFSTDDMTFVNLEGVLKADKKGETTSKEFRFRGLPEWTEILHLASIEQVSIANNHYIDYGTAGREATREALTNAGIPFSGYEYTYVWEKDGLKIGFGGIRETVYKQDPSILYKDVLALKNAGCDVIIYTCHWGTEYDPNRNELQERIACAAAAAGVDILVGGHPHIVQGVDSVEDMPVIYSLGNLMFGGTINMQGYDAMLAQLRLRFRDGEYVGVTVELIPVLTSSRAAENVNDYCPVVAEGEDKARILQKVQDDTPFQLADTMYWPVK
ncbi:MAG: CapA family protein [Clostridia bacterium]|nr:CapA family protein [Clostridia bacterium]